MEKRSTVYTSGNMGSERRASVWKSKDERSPYVVIKNHAVIVPSLGFKLSSAQSPVLFCSAISAFARKAPAGFDPEVTNGTITLCAAE